MRRFADLYAALDSTNSTRAKLALLSAYFQNVDAADGAWAVYLLSGGKPRQAVPARDDLWGALRDPEADIEIRAAAARVLVRVDGDDARKRVRAVAASVRVASDADHILAALDPDTEVAATKLRRR